MAWLLLQITSSTAFVLDDLATTRITWSVKANAYIQHPERALEAGDITVSALKKPRIFISFAIEDKSQRDFLVGQAKNAKCPFQLVDMSVKEPWENNWKTRCRSKMKGCDGVIALISKNTSNAEGAKWEMHCAVEQKIPILPVYAYSNDRSPVPRELRGKRAIPWTWAGVDAFLSRLDASRDARRSRAATAGPANRNAHTAVLIVSAILAGALAFSIVRKS